MQVQILIMKHILIRTTLCISLVCMFLVGTTRLFAAVATPGQLLQQAYTTLEMADHDYKGHRAAAMKQIEAAGKLVGVNVRGDGKGHEKQGVSDAQLRTAESLLNQAKSGLSGKALAHVNHALKQLSIALSIK